MRSAILFGAILISSIAAHTATAETCFSNQTLQELSQNFKQLKTFADSGKPEICSKEMGPQWTQIVETLVDLRELSIPDLSGFKTQDDFSKKAVDEKAWWNYFPTRANAFDLNGKSCRQGVVAYVYPFLPGVINLCEVFYQQPRIGRLETLLHEVRHFDGYGHVTCTQGALFGSKGACDNNINDKGSYAISIQANVALGLLSERFDEGTKAFARASALFVMYNQFNEKTNVKIHKDFLVENESGEIYSWDPKKGDKVSRIKKLREPARIFTAGLETIFYPMDPTKKAYRLNDDLESNASRLGMFADHYNSLPVSERAQFIGAGYNTNGSLLLKNKVTSLCGEKGLQAIPASAFDEPMVSMISVIPDGHTVRDMLVGQSGRLYETTCTLNRMYAVYPLDHYVPSNLYRAFPLENTSYGLSTSGEIYVLNEDQGRYSYGEMINFSGHTGKWIEMSQRVMPYLYVEAQSVASH